MVLTEHCLIPTIHLTNASVSKDRCPPEQPLGGSAKSAPNVTHSWGNRRHFRSTILFVRQAEVPTVCKAEFFLRLSGS